MKLIGVAFFFILIYSPGVFSQKLIHSEILGRPTKSGITIQAFFEDTTEVSIQFGTSKGTYPFQTNWKNFPPGDPAEIQLSGLQENTRYYYRMGYRKPGSSEIFYRPEFSFHTARSQGSAFTFIVQADPHLDEQSDTALYSRSLNNQLGDSPDFMIDLGDFLMSDKLRRKDKTVPRDTITYRCSLLRSFYEKSCHSVPLFIALGNHEGESGWNLNGTAENIAVWGTNDRKKFFMNPYPDGFYSGDTNAYAFVGKRESYYSWQWGDALFVVLDPYWFTNPKPDSLNGWRWTLGKIQYDWLRETLESSDATFKFVFAHQLIGGNPDGRGGVEYADLYEWGGENPDGSPGFAQKRQGWYKPIKDLLKENRVNIFFHGHDHFFGKQEKDCLIYQETPQPSHPNFTGVSYATDYGYLQGQIIPNSGYLRVTVDPLRVKTEYVRTYLPKNETQNRRNKDVSATYFIDKTNCYDSISAAVPVLWNQNYSDEMVFPNPFYGQAIIRFNLREKCNLELFISDISGRKVRQLFSRNTLLEGSFQTVWDGLDNYGNPLKNGTYFYTLLSKNGKIKSGKIILQHE